MNISFLAFNRQRQKWPWFQEGNKIMENSRALLSATRHCSSTCPQLSNFAFPMVLQVAFLRFHVQDYFLKLKETNCREQSLPRYELRLFIPFLVYKALVLSHILFFFACQPRKPDINMSSTLCHKEIQVNIPTNL